MNEEVKKFTEEIRVQLAARFASNEVKEVIDATTKGSDSDLGTFQVVITTENVDRYGEVIKLDGWELEHYRNSPVVLWGHDHHTLPIGMATSVEAIDGKMIASGKFAPHEHAQTIRKLYDMGMMRATSVGFIEKEREGNLITKAELIEFSFVSVPANPYALSTMVKSGVSINEMVTKGFVVVREQEEEPEKPVFEPQVPAADPVVDPDPQDPAEKHFDTKAVDPIIANLKSVIVALEELVKDQEPEGDAAPEDDEEEKRYKDFSEKRRVVQNASTILAEVLAEARQAIEARKAA